MSQAFKNEIVLTAEQMDAAMARGRKMRSYAVRDMVIDLFASFANVGRKADEAAQAPSRQTTFGKAA